MSLGIIVRPNGKIQKIWDSPEYIFSNSNGDSYYSCGRLYSLDREKQFRVPLKMFRRDHSYDLVGIYTGFICYKYGPEKILMNIQGSDGSLQFRYKYKDHKIYDIINGGIWYHLRVVQSMRVKSIQGLQNIFVNKCNLDNYTGFVALNNNIHRFNAYKENIYMSPEIYLRGFTISGNIFVRIAKMNISRDAFADILIGFP